MNYLEKQTDGEAIINCLKHGDQPLPRVTQVSIARTSSTEQPSLKDKSMCNKTVKDLWDALARHMLGSEYREQDRKAAVLYEYETFKATEEELLLDTYIRYLQVINDLEKYGYSKDNCELNFKFLNNLQPEWKQLKKKTVVVTSDPLSLIAEKTKVSKRKEKVVVSSDSKGSDADDFSKLKKNIALLAKDFNQRKFYSKPTNNNLRTASTSQSANKKQEYVKSDDKKVEKKDDEKKRDMSKVKCYNCKKEGHFAKDCKKGKVKDYEYYKTKMLLAKKDKDKQVLLAEDHAWMESSSDSNQEINVNMVFMAQIKKVLSDSEASSSSADDKISEVSYYLSEFKSKSEYETSEYYDNTTTYGLFVNENDDQEIFHDCENFLENLIESQINHNKSVVDHNDSKGIDKLKRKFNKKIAKCFKQKIIIDLEDEVVSLLEKEKENLKTIESLKSKDVEKGIESSEKVVFETENKSENDCQVIEKVCDSEKNPNMIAPGMFKLNLDTLSSVRRHKPSGVMWMKKGSSNIVKADLSSVNHSNLIKNVKRYSRENLMACTNSDTRRCSKHITGNHALLTNFVEKFLKTVRFGNNDFAVIAGYGDVVIGSMTIKKIYYVKDGVDLLTGDRSSDLYTIALNEVASNSSACLLAKASSSQS
nr:hypothetical protein [Tanacetum cinerariifolium]